ncbi:MAG TPA: MBL fold metallo-hydrolase [Vicinamibacterales bacterium]
MRIQAMRNLRVVRTWLALATVVAVLMCSAPVRAAGPVDLINAEAAKRDITVQQLRGGVSVVMGSGGNITVLETPAGKLLVDGGIALSRPRLDEVLVQIGAGKPEYLVNTHWHWDHTDSNEWLHGLGATIIGHPNTLKHLSHTVRVEDWQHTFEPVPSAARPTVLVEKSRSLDFGGEKVLIKHYRPAHTDGDLSVYFANADVLATGDTYWNGVYPFIDYVAGGSIDGMIRAADANMAQAKETTLIVPGHGPVAHRADLVEFRDMLVTIRANVAKLKGEGKSLDEAIAARPTAAFDAKWGQFVINPAFFTSLVYRGV